MSYARIIAADPMVDEQSWNAISVEAAEVAGEIFGVNIFDYTTVESFGSLQFPILSIPLGHTVYAGAGGRNTGNADLIMTLTIQLMDPDGIVRSEAVYTPDRIIVPADYFFENTSDSKVTLDKAGTWVLYIKLEAELA